MKRPASGSMVYWRFKKQVPCGWSIGYCTYESGPDLMRMGRWRGDTVGGMVVSFTEVEWKPYR